MGGAGCGALREARGSEVRKKKKERINTEDTENRQSTESTEKSSERPPNGSGAFVLGRIPARRGAKRFHLEQMGRSMLRPYKSRDAAKKEGRPPWRAPFQELNGAVTRVSRSRRRLRHLRSRDCLRRRQQLFAAFRGLRGSGLCGIGEPYCPRWREP